MLHSKYVVSLNKLDQLAELELGVNIFLCVGRFPEHFLKPTQTGQVGLVGWTFRNSMGMSFLPVAKVINTLQYLVMFYDIIQCFTMSYDIP